MKDDIFNAICLMNYLDEKNKINDYKEFFMIILNRYIKKRDNRDNFIYRVYNNEIIIFSDADKDDSLFIWTIYSNDKYLNCSITGLRFIDFNLNTKLKFIRNDEVYYGYRKNIFCIDIRRCVELLILQDKLKPIIAKDLSSIYFYNDSTIVNHPTIVFEYTSFPYSTFDNITEDTEFLDGFECHKPTFK